MKRFLSLFLLLLVAPVTPAPAEPGPPPAAANDPLENGLKAVASYDYGADRAAIVAFDDYIRSQHGGDRAKVEAALLPMLAREDVATGAKDYICRWLGVIGSDASVPALQKLVDDPKLSHLAVYALLSLHTPAARVSVARRPRLDARARSVPRSSGPSAGRAWATAVPVLAKIASSAEAAEATAALDALGDMGTPAAFGSVARGPRWRPRWKPRGGGRCSTPPTPCRDEGRVGAGRGEGGLDPAAHARDGCRRCATAAAKGAIQADPAGALDVLLPLLKDEDARVRLRRGPADPAAFRRRPGTLAPALAALDPATQAAIVNILAQARSAGIGPILRRPWPAAAGGSPGRHRRLRRRELARVRGRPAPAVGPGGRRRGRRRQPA